MADPAVGSVAAADVVLRVLHMELEGEVDDVVVLVGPARVVAGDRLVVGVEAVADVADAVAVAVGLVGVGDRRAVVDPVEHAVPVVVAVGTGQRAVAELLGAAAVAAVRAAGAAAYARHVLLAAG